MGTAKVRRKEGSKLITALRHGEGDDALAKTTEGTEQVPEVVWRIRDVHDRAALHRLRVRGLGHRKQISEYDRVHRQEAAVHPERDVTTEEDDVPVVKP